MSGETNDCNALVEGLVIGILVKLENLIEDKNVCVAPNMSFCLRRAR